MSNVYVASSWRNEFQPAVVAMLRADGHRVYDFRGPGDGWGTGGDGPGGFGWHEIDPDWKEQWIADVPRYLKALRHTRAAEGFKRDMDALRSADACILVMPCGPSASMEMGFSVGAGKRTYVYMPAIREPDLMVLMADYVGQDFDHIRWLLGTGL